MKNILFTRALLCAIIFAAPVVAKTEAPKKAVKKASAPKTSKKGSKKQAPKKVEAPQAPAVVAPVTPVAPAPVKPVVKPVAKKQKSNTGMIVAGATVAAVATAAVVDHVAFKGAGRKAIATFGSKAVRALPFIGARLKAQDEKAAQDADWNDKKGALGLGTAFVAGVTGVVVASKGGFRPFVNDIRTALGKAPKTTEAKEAINPNAPRVPTPHGWSDGINASDRLPNQWGWV